MWLIDNTVKCYLAEITVISMNLSAYAESENFKLLSVIKRYYKIL